MMSIWTGFEDAAGETFSDADLLNRAAELRQHIADKAPTLRDQFAMAALTGICANQAINPTKIDRNASGFARSIYDLADAMMNARNAA